MCVRVSLQDIVFGGDDWLLARFHECEDITPLSQVLQSVAQKLRDGGFFLEVIPSLCDIAVRFDAMIYMPKEAQDILVRSLRVEEVPQEKLPEVMRIPVCYSKSYAPDIAQCAQALSLSPKEIIAQHTAKPLFVQMMGFVPGFAYCGELSHKLCMPRLKEPRSYVAEGSIGIVGRQTCIYSLAGPGGWSLIGRTPLRLFNIHAKTPFLLQAGTVVHFYEIDEMEFHKYKNFA